MPAETIAIPAKPASVAFDAPPPVTAAARGAQRADQRYPEAYDELEGLDGPPAAPKERAPAAPAKAPEGAEKGADAAKRDEAGRFAKQAEEAAKPEGAKAEGAPAPKAPEGAKSEAAPDAEPDPTARFQLATDLRKAFRKLHKEHDALRGEVVGLRAKAQAKPDETALSEARELRQRLADAEQELRYLDYTRSTEFKEKHSKPYERAFNAAVAEVEELYVLDGDGNPARPATERDLRDILTAAKTEVKALARTRFGEDASEVLALRRKLNEMNSNANQEAEGYREKAAERDRAKAVRAAEEREGMERLWKTKVGEVAEKYKQFFGKVEDDDEYNAALADGYARIDAAHAPDLPMEDKVARLAVIRHKAAAFGAQVLLNRRLKGRVAELEEALKEYEKSVPAGGKGGKDARVAGEADGIKSAAEELEELDRKFPGDR